MDSMKCWDCADKHLSAALSYAKEVMGGHDHKADLNHCADLSGELVNAEHHLLLLSLDFMHQVRDLRYKLKQQRWIPVEADLEFIRKLWAAVLEATPVDIPVTTTIVTSTAGPLLTIPYVDPFPNITRVVKRCGGCGNKALTVNQPVPVNTP